MNFKRLGLLLALAALAALLVRGVFVVSDTDAVVLSRYNRMSPVELEAGLHWRWPMDGLFKVDRREATRSYVGEVFTTSEKQTLVVDLLVNWHVIDPRRQLLATGGREELAEQRLGQIVVDNLKAAVAKRTLRQFIAEPAATLRAEAVGIAAPNLRELGVALDAVQLQRVQLPDDLSAAVYQRMQEGFDVLAGQRRAEGEAEAARVRAAADKQQAQILADGERNAQRIRGEGEAQASLISGRAFARSPQFAAFYRSMQAYRAAMGRPGDLLVIAPDGEFFKYLHSNAQH